MRRDRVELEEFRALGLDCLEHAPERSGSFASMAARLEARRWFGDEFLRACRRFEELSAPIDGQHRRTTLAALIEVEWRMREAA